jgi:xylobiose transport system substrate-binding protein
MGTSKTCRVIAVLTATLTLACTVSCGSDSTSSEGDRTISLWMIKGSEINKALANSVERYNSAHTAKIRTTTYPNEEYKSRIRAVMDTDTAPDIFFTWGGGNLEYFVRADQAVDLTEELDRDPQVEDDFLPTVLKNGAVDGRQFGLPMSGMQPILLFYNKKILAEHDLQPPKTLDDLFDLVQTFKGKGIVPIALGGKQGWTELTHLMAIVDRIGGPKKFEDIAAGKPGAWKDPVVLTALRKCQDLVRRGAFGGDFYNLGYDSGEATDMLAGGQAAMHLMGTWEYQFQLTSHPGFAGEDLGWTVYPTVLPTGGSPRTVVGPPSNYFSVRKGSPYTAQAVDFLLTTLTSEPYLRDLIAVGSVPAVTRAESLFRGTRSEDFVSFVFQTVSDAPAFTPSWDQALSPAAGDHLNGLLQKLFLLQMTPERFAEAMEKAIGSETS